MNNTTLQHEQVLAGRIISLEQQSLELLRQYPSVQPLIQELQDQPRKHNSTTIERMEEALLIVQQQEQTSSRNSTIKKIRTMFRQAELLRWELALTAKHIAELEARRMSSHQLSQEDLLQEGYIGLLEAAKRYDPEREIRFTTYARWWVRAQMARCIENTGRLVRIPGGAIEQLRNLQRLIEEQKNNSEKVDIQRLSKQLGISRKRAELLLSLQGSVSLDTEDDDGRSFSEVIPFNEVSLEEQLIRREAKQLLQEQFGNFLDEREQFILINHFGLDDRPKKTMREIGEEISLSKERVRQIEAKAIIKLQEIFI
jgi:RNA polymerase sigma factor (sigma-70 family)